MRLLSCITTVVGVTSLFISTAAHSVARNALEYLTLIEDPVIHTPSHRVHSLSSFDLTFQLHNKEQQIKLTLSPNHDVIAEGATVQYLRADGSVRLTEYIDRTEHKVFLGQAWIQHTEGAEWTNIGWARIVVHRDGKAPVFEGAFQVEGDHHHIQLRHNYLKTKHLLDPHIEDEDDDIMVVWRDSDIIPNDSSELRRGLGDMSCLSDSLEFNMQPDLPLYQSTLKKDTGIWGSMSMRSIFGRQLDNSTGGNSGGVNLLSTIGDSSGCPNTRKVALVGIATDCTYSAKFNSSSATRSHIIDMMNSASQLYESSFNISLGIQNLTISDTACPGTAPAATPWNVPCSNSIDISDRLNLFSGWRASHPDTNAYWTLLSTCGSGSAVGLAWVGQACVTAPPTPDSNQTVSSANVVVYTGTEWQVIAHETGHTFGAVHDCTSTTCSDGVTVNAQGCCPLSSSTCDAGQRFIMNPATANGITKFSACSVGNICSAIGRNSVKTNCLTSNRNVATITGSQCGNGIVEVGEDCDCGGVEGCGPNACCDPKTCKFKGNAVCDNSNEDCCTSSCQFASNNTVCRPSTGSCDPQETCSGSSSTCPVDVSSPEGTACGDAADNLSCASGHCTSRDLQCKTLMGSIRKDNTTYACPGLSTCQIACVSPEFDSQCYRMQQNFLDGTTCGGGGRCSNGACQGSSAGGEITNWINNNKNLVIGLSVGIGSFLIISILACCISSCRRRRRVKNMPRPPQMPSYRPRMPVQQPRQGVWGAGGQWIDPVPMPQTSHRGNNQLDPRWSPAPQYDGQYDQYNSQYNNRGVRYA